MHVSFGFRTHFEKFYSNLVRYFLFLVFSSKIFLVLVCLNYLFNFDSGILFVLSELRTQNNSDFSPNSKEKINLISDYFVFNII